MATCEEWCGGEIAPADARVFGKCMRPDRYFCTEACQRAERPLSPQPDVPAHEAFTLRHMMNAWKAAFSEPEAKVTMHIVARDFDHRWIEQALMKFAEMPDDEGLLFGYEPSDDVLYRVLADMKAKKAG